MRKFPFTITKYKAMFDRLGGFDWQEFGDFILGKKEGTKGWLEYHQESKPRSPEQFGYYYAVILPEATKEMKAKSLQPHNSTILEFVIESVKGGDKKVTLPITEKCVDSMLKLIHGMATGDYMDKADMDMAECSSFEDWCIRWLAEHKEIFIPPADRNWKKETVGDKLE